ncbi:MAG: hypothetical protein MJA83_05515 [Gammaproteobacteria bacterium]|nr:hypothetical protein [Gammaproteobacteria bacterium]
MSASVWEELRSQVKAISSPKSFNKDLAQQAIDFADLLVWWGNRISGKIKLGDLTIVGLSIQPASKSDGFCLTIRGKLKRDDVVGFHMCKSVVPGLAEARERLLRDSVQWRIDSKLSTGVTTEEAAKTSERFDTARFE